MKTANLKVLLAAALIAGTGAFARADETGGEELVASAEASLWLGPDEFVEAFGEAMFCLAPEEMTEFVEAFGEKEFALVAFRDLPANPTVDDIRAAILASGAVDKDRLLALILASVDPFSAYRAFQAWAEELDDLAVTGSAYAGDSFALGAAELFASKPKMEITSAAAGSNATGETEMFVAVTVKDGETAKPVSAAKVAKMFEATSDLTDWDEKKLTPTVTVRTQDEVATPVEFTVKPGDGKAPHAFLRLRQPQ